MTHDSMIASAKRLARRMASRTDLSYQQALEKIARELGRDHWAAYLASPVAVPRDVAEDGMRIGMPDIGDPTAIETFVKRHITSEQAEATDSRASEGGLLAESWNLPDGVHTRLFAGNAFVPAWNALDEERLPPAGAARDRHIARIAAILIPAGGSPHFSDRARDTLEGFIALETVLAGVENRTASIPHMVDWLTRSFQEIANHAETGAQEEEATVRWLRMVMKHASGRSGSLAVERRIGSLIEMQTRERQSVLGTMNKGLLVFRNETVRMLNA